VTSACKKRHQSAFADVALLMMKSKLNNSPVFALVFAAVLAALHSAAAHPTRYPRHPKPDCKAAAPILSYHVHVVFGFNQFDEAMAVRNRTIERFR
jgi:hypothetical protein